MIVCNYTKIKRRDKKVYSLFDTTVSQSGWSMKTIKTCGLMLAGFSILGLLFCVITKTFWYNPLLIAKSSKSGYFYLIFVFIPIIMGTMLNSYKIQNYKAVDYLKIYFKPKRTINQDGKKVKLEKYDINTFIERM